MPPSSPPPPFSDTDESLSERDAVAVVVTLLAFLRLYLGKAATEEVVLKLALRSLGDVVQGFTLAKINAKAWAGLVEVEVPAVEEDPEKVTELKNFEFNAIASSCQCAPYVWHSPWLAAHRPRSFSPATLRVTADVGRCTVSCS